MKTIFHLDLDAFFVSVERLLNPSLIGKPVIVGADPKAGYGRGVIAACSYEARQFGLHSAMPIRTAYKLCPHGEYVKGHMKEYSKHSKQVKALLEKYAPVIEQTSIDEFYLDFSGTSHMYGEMGNFAIRLQNEIWEELKLPCSIGIASNKTIAKIASDFFKPKGITHVKAGMEKEFLSKMPLSAIPGVGRQTLPQLKNKGIEKVEDVLKLPEEYWSAAYGKAGISLWKKANGRGSEIVNPAQERKSISKERTYSEDVMNIEKVENTLFKLTGEVCQILRDKNWLASTITMKLRYSDFATLTRSKTIYPTDDDKTVYETAREMFEKAYTRRVSIRLIGVGLTNFCEFAEQEELFEDEDILRKKMLRAVTKIRDNFGFSSINIGINEKK
ncbi:MAG: DNA polymerase IV [Rhodothermaceae bacterium]